MAVATKKSLKSRTSTAAKKAKSVKRAASARARSTTSASSTRGKKADVVTVDRRRKTERRASSEKRRASQPVTCERRKLQRRVAVNRRRQIDPTTCERDYTAEEIAFMNALDEYKRKSGRMFPTCSEVLEVIKDLGYIQPSGGEKTADTVLSSTAEDAAAAPG